MERGEAARIEIKTDQNNALSWKDRDVSLHFLSLSLTLRTLSSWLGWVRLTHMASLIFNTAFDLNELQFQCCA